MRGFSAPTRAASAWKAGAAIAGLFYAASTSAGTLTLTSGEQINARLVAVEAGRLIFASVRFGQVAIPLAELQTYVNEAAVTLNLDSGERIVVQQMSADGKAVRALTRFGQIQSPWAEVVAVVEAEPASRVSSGVGATTSADVPSAEPGRDARNSLTVDFGHQSNQFRSLAGGTRTRLTSINFSYARAIGQTTSAIVDAPFFYNQVSISDFGDTIRDHETSVGDIRFSLSRVFRSKGFLPHLQVTLSGGLPTGSSGGPSDRNLAGFSSGLWSVGGMAGLQKSLGSGALLANLGYSRYFPRQGGRSIGQTDWAVGFGVPLTDGWAFGGSVAGSSTTSDGTTVETAYLMLRPSYSSGPLTVSPYITMGLNTDAEDYRLGLSISRSW